MSDFDETFRVSLYILVIWFSVVFTLKFTKLKNIVTALTSKKFGSKNIFLVHRVYESSVLLISLR